MADEQGSGFPINKEALRSLEAWTTAVPEQARRALAVNGPKIKAAFDRFAEALAKSQYDA